LSHTAAMRGEIETRKYFGFESILPFFAAHMGQNLIRLWRIGRDCHAWCLSNPAEMRGEIGTRNCFSLKSKVPIFTARFRPNCWRFAKSVQGVRSFMFELPRWYTRRDRDEKLFRPQE
jgi:hypothetical protein